MLNRYAELVDGIKDDNTSTVLATIGDVYSLWTLLTHTGTLYQGTSDPEAYLFDCPYSLGLILI